MSQEPLFHPVSICALDASYRAVRTLGVPDDARLHRMQPALHWRWEGTFTTSAIALFDPAAHAGQACFPQWMAPGRGIYKMTDPRLAGLRARAQHRRDWLVGSPVLLLEDQPSQGDCIQQGIQALGLPCRWAQDGEICLQPLAQREMEVARYPDDPVNLLDAAQWQERGISGRW